MKDKQQRIDNVIRLLEKVTGKRVRLVEADQLDENRYANWKTEHEEASRNRTWQAFLGRFNQERKKAYQQGDPETYNNFLKHKDKTAFEAPSIRFVDEWQHETIGGDTTPGSREVRPMDWDKSPNSRVQFKGLSNVEFGDIIIHFRWGYYHFKPTSKDGSTIAYKYAGEALSAHNKENMWPDQNVFQGMIKNLQLIFQKDEVPMIYRQNAPKKIRGNNGWAHSRKNDLGGANSKYSR